MVGASDEVQLVALMRAQKRATIVRSSVQSQLFQTSTPGPSGVMTGIQASCASSIFERSNRISLSSQSVP